MRQRWEEDNEGRAVLIIDSLQAPLTVPPPLQPHAVLLRLSGQIASGKGSALNASKPLNLQNYESQLERCFKKPGAVAIVLEINSPGGSPAQSSLLHSRLRYLKKKYPDAPPVHAFCTDVCASGGYYIASACDEIYVLPSTIIGSVGVVSPR